jgi:uncharacterized membrane protein
VEKTPIALAFAILDLGVSFVSYTEQQYFSAMAMPGIFLLALLSVAIFLLSYMRYFDDSGKGGLALAFSLAASVLLMYYDLAFNLVSPQILGFALKVVFFVSIAAAISIVSIYAISRATKVLYRTINSGIVITAILDVVLVLALCFPNALTPHPSALLSIVILIGLAFAVILSLIMVYYASVMTRGHEEKKRLKNAAWVIIAIYLIAASALAYGSMYAWSTNQGWGGVDELAANYYASYLFLHGANPYTQSMKPILDARAISPTVLLNGTYEYAYDYPALSFLLYVPITALGITSFYSFVAVLILLSMVSSFAVYYKSKCDNRLLIPLAAWLVLCFSLVSVSNTFFAVSIFLFFAYIFKEKPFVSGLLLGLGASVTQVAWFALPFFYVLTLRHHGKKEVLNQILASLLVFALVNSYFIILSPKATLGNIFALFGTTNLPFYGPNIMQFFVRFYPVSYSFTELASGALILWSLAMLYLYTKSAKPLLVLVPAFVFFLAWRNISIYAIPYVPIMLLMCYYKDRLDTGEKDILKTKRPMLYSALAIIVIVFVAMLYSHYSYMSEDTFYINQAMPIVYVGFNNYTDQYQFSLGGIFIKMTNNAAHSENVSFLMVSRSPNNEAYILSTTVNALPPEGASNYSLDYQLPMVNNSTKLYVVAFSKDYITSKELNVSIEYRPQVIPAGGNQT